MTTIRYAPAAAWRTVYYDPRIQIRPDQSFIRATLGSRVVGIRHKTKQVPL